LLLLIIMFSRDLVHDGHTHRFVVTAIPDGWSVCEEEDARVVRTVRRDDWHRVERDRQLFDLTARTLKRDGWVERARCEAA
jgi:hypothetical protein